MKRFVIILLVSLLCAGSLCARINLPDADQFTLANGMTVAVIERHALPLVGVGFLFRAGSIHDPAGKEGLANLCNRMLTRGTTTRTAEQIAEDISYYGGDWYNYCQPEEAGFYAEFLADHIDHGLEILQDLLLYSAFADDQVEWSKNQTLSELESRYEDPAGMADEYIYQAILGSNPYAHLPAGTESSVAALTRDDIIQFSRSHYTPDNCVLIICGDVKSDTIKAWITAHFAGWSGKAQSSAVNAGFLPVAKTKVLIVDKPDATQTQIRIGKVGFRKGDSLSVPFETARSIYATAFTSRLVDELRVKRGLTYRVSLRSDQYRAGGINYVATFTQNETVGEVIEIILRESERMQIEPVPDSELAGGINYQNGQYPLEFETNNAIVGTFMEMWLYGLPKSFFTDFQEESKRVTAGQVMEAAKRFFPVGDYRLVLVGKAAEIRSQVEKYGPIEIVPIVPYDNEQ
jgi:zinc protease